MMPQDQSVLEGYCHCLCGQRTTLITETRLNRGLIKGQYRPFIRGHQGCDPRPMSEEAAPFKINGVYCRLIPLTKGYYAIVFEVDYRWLAQYRWQAWVGKKGNIYAARKGGPGEPRMVLMHRQIGALKGITFADHESGIGLDNRRDNLRQAKAQQNTANAKKNSRNTTGYKGVQKTPWGFRAMIYVNGKHIYLGSDKDPAVCHEMYKIAAVKYFGEFARFA